MIRNPRPEDERCIRRVAIVGVGAVGATSAYAMLQAGSAAQIVLVDQNQRKAEGELMDLQHCLPFTEPADIRVRPIAEVEGCDMVVVTAGAPQKPGEPRLDLVKRNTEVFSAMIPVLARHNPEARMVIVTNPVDVMTRVALRFSGMPPERVFGTGTMLDTARFRTLLSQHCRILPRHVHAYVIGEHGDSEVLVWSRTMIGPFHISEYCELQGISISPDETEAIERGVRGAAMEIIERKGSTHFAIGLTMTMLAESLYLEENSILTVSREFHGAYGLHGVCLSVPTLVNRRGAHTHLELPLSPNERQALMRSAEILEEVYDGLDLAA